MVSAIVAPTCFSLSNIATARWPLTQRKPSPTTTTPTTDIICGSRQFVPFLSSCLSLDCVFSFSLFPPPLNLCLAPYSLPPRLRILQCVCRPRCYHNPPPPLPPITLDGRSITLRLGSFFIQVTPLNAYTFYFLSIPGEREKG